jgi:hypothetical protein
MQPRLKLDNSGGAEDRLENGTVSSISLRYVGLGPADQVVVGRRGTWSQPIAGQQKGCSQRGTPVPTWHCIFCDMGGGQKLLARAPLPLLFSVFFLKEIFRCCSKGRERFFFLPQVTASVGHEVLEASVVRLK